MKSNLRKLMAVLLTVALLWTTVIPAFAEDVLVPEEDVIFAEPVDEAAAEVEEDLGNGLSAGDEEEQELTFDGQEAADEAVEQPIEADPVDAADVESIIYSFYVGYADSNEATGVKTEYVKVDGKDTKEIKQYSVTYNGKSQKPTVVLYAHNPADGTDNSKDTVVPENLYKFSWGNGKNFTVANETDSDETTGIKPDTDSFVWWDAREANKKYPDNVEADAPDDELKIAVSAKPYVINKIELGIALKDRTFAIGDAVTLKQGLG